ncbi:MAG: hypothetical protein M0Z61_04305 [Nitrospiraceae bacterium]|nr:hypothetical protein [Nitrospiraceae bacterium]
MRTIRISEEVWDEMKKIGQFGETADDVLRRVFKVQGSPKRARLPLPGNPEDITRPIEAASEKRIKPRPRYAERKMPCYIADNHLVVEFVGGLSKRFALPSHDDKMAIRKVRTDAVDFAKDNGASDGQIAAVKKTLTDAGYHLTK